MKIKKSFILQKEIVRKKKKSNYVWFKIFFSLERNLINLFNCYKNNFQEF